MGAEIGATYSLFPYDDNMAAYLKATGREAIADAATKVASDLRPDPEVEADPTTYYDRVVEIDLDSCSRSSTAPTPPTWPTRSARSAHGPRANGVPVEVSSALIGSCTNSSYEDITRAASIARQAAAKGLRAKTQLLITPGSEQVRATIERDGLLADLEAIGGDGAGQRLRALHRPVGAHRPRPVEGEHHRQQLQPQLPQAQRRQRQHQGAS